MLHNLHSQVFGRPYELCPSVLQPLLNTLRNFDGSRDLAQRISKLVLCHMLLNLLTRCLFCFVESWQAWHCTQLAAQLSSVLEVEYLPSGSPLLARVAGYLMMSAMQHPQSVVLLNAVVAGSGWTSMPYRLACLKTCRKSNWWIIQWLSFKTLLLSKAINYV